MMPSAGGFAMTLILTIDELIAGAGVSYPRGGAPATFRQAPRRRRRRGRQSSLV